MKRNGRRGFTLIELLVVVAIIALLLSILLPALSGAREQAKKAKCLANLNGIGKNLFAYANDDAAEQMIPIHMAMVGANVPVGTFNVAPQLGRCANWFAWGGSSATRVFKISDTDGFLLSDTLGVESMDSVLKVEYAANRRPLNVYTFGDAIGQNDQKALEQFRCPSDTGYPEDPRGDGSVIDDSPPANARRSCYETLGNSYRGSLAMYGRTSLSEPYTAAFATGVWGHRLTTLPEPGRLVVAGEPTFFNMIGTDTGGGWEDVAVQGWHKKKMVDNLVFADGSARATKAERDQEVDGDSMGLDPSTKKEGKFKLSRGAQFRLDVYPVGGAIIFNKPLWRQNDSGMWPFRNMQDNLIAAH